MTIGAGGVARENVLHTYADLARSTRAGRVEHRNGYLLASGPATHAFCNFAAGFSSSLEAEEIALLASRSNGGRKFWVFSMEGDRSPGLIRALTSAGFRTRTRLVQLLASPVANELDSADREVLVSSERYLVARFMAAQFFPQMDPEKRDVIALATADSNGQIYARFQKGRPVSAFMLSNTEGACGVYNLCVHPALRGNGIGKELMHLAMGIAHSRGVESVLQCEESLVPWYSRFGYREAGHLVALSKHVENIAPPGAGYNES